MNFYQDTKLNSLLLKKKLSFLSNMKKFKTERIIYFDAKYLSKIEPNIIISKPKETYINKFICRKENFPQNFLKKKLYPFHVKKYDSYIRNQSQSPKEGRWTLKEHIQYLQALEKFGINWRKMSDLIPSRTTTQIRSHSQKFYKKLKECKDIELGIDFTSRNIKNVNDMITHIKSVNKDYNIVTVFLYLSEKCYPDKNPKKENKLDNININNILTETINLNNINDESYFNNDIKKNVVNKNINMNQPIINNNFNVAPINNILITNINYFNGNNDSDPLFYSNNSNTSEHINKNMSLQNNPLNNNDIFNNFFNNINSKSLLDNYIIFENPINK